MSNENKLTSFPSTKAEVLAMLYLRNQDLSGVSPEELYDAYEDAYNRIKKHQSDKKESWF